jgi:uncharacterized repeat protein (TIGR04076 family)
MFKVRIKVVEIKGDESRYPCHCLHRIGDEVIFDGDSYTGKLCVDLWPKVTEKAAILYSVGPRWVEPINYLLVHYTPVSQEDPSRKIYDGKGFRAVYEGYKNIPKYHMVNLIGKDEFKWPPVKERVNYPITVMCPDPRTAVVVQLEAFDIADGGYAKTFYRRQMVILDRVLKKPGVREDKILNEFSKKEIEDIYPPLTPIMVKVMVEELVLVCHMKINDGKAYVTKKGEAKVKEFQKSLTAEERKALKV